jgi:hypothetical protein
MPDEPRTDEGRAEAARPAARVTWFLDRRRDPETGEVDGAAYRAALARRRDALREQVAVGGPGAELAPGGPGSYDWTPIGPSVTGRAGNTVDANAVSGRVTALAVGPGGARAYLGSANGGLWFTPDGGTTWQPLDDFLTSAAFSTGGREQDALSVGAVRVRFGATAATDDVYVGTGEPSFNIDRYFGIGVRHSAAGGAPGTWTLEATNLAGNGVFELAVDPDNPAFVLAATQGGLFQRPAAAPFTTWAQQTAGFTTPNGRCTSVVVAGTGAAKRWYAAFAGETVVWTSTNGTVWTTLTGLPAITTPNSGRTVLAVAESDPTVVYALRQEGQLYRLVGTAFQAVAGIPAALFNGAQGWYDIALAVDPANADTVYLGGDQYAVWKGTITGGPGAYTFPFTNVANPAADATWIGSGVHSDVHVVTHALNAAGTAHDPSIVWVGCDGGAFVSTTGGGNGSYHPRNTGLATMQPTFLAQHPTLQTDVLVGTQDNGTQRFLGEAAWLRVDGGDGGGVTFDQNDPTRVLHQYYATGLARSTDSGRTWGSVTFPPVTSASAAQTASANAESDYYTSARKVGFYGPIRATPPGSPTLAFYGTHRLWATSDMGATGSWVTLPTGTNPYTPATPLDGQDSIDGTPITAIAVGSADVVYAATATAIRRYVRSGAAWTATTLPTAGLPTRTVTNLAVEDAAAGRIYATLGFSSTGGHLYYYDGAAWHPALPTATVDAPAHACVVDPASATTLYVGTDVGCWKGTRSGTPAAPVWNWTVFSYALPECAIVDLAIDPTFRLLRAALHGRGTFEVPLDVPSAGTAQSVYLRVNYADTGRLDAAGARNPAVEGAVDPTSPAFRIYHWMSPDIKVRRGSLSGLPALATPVDHLEYATHAGDYVDSTTNVETADVSGANRVFVEVHTRSLTPLPAPQVRVLLLLADASTALPLLPVDWQNHVNAGDTSAAWLGSTGWRFADPGMPYRSPSRDVDVRNPGVVEFPTVDFTSLALPAMHEHVCAAAFVVAGSDLITSTSTSLDFVTMHDRKVAHRNLHVVAAGARPITVPGGVEEFEQEPRIVLLDFHNRHEKETRFEIEVQRPAFAGDIVVTLPGDLKGDGDGVEVVHPGKLDDVLTRVHRELFDTLEERIKSHGAGNGDGAGRLARRLRKLHRLDRERVHVATGKDRMVLRDLVLPARESVTAALVFRAPPEARPGDEFRVDVIHREEGEIVGGSSYSILVVKQG